MSARAGVATVLFVVAIVAALGAVHSAEAQTAGLTEDLLRHTTYPSEFSPTRSVTLRDGRYEWNQPPLRGYAVFARAVIGPEYAAVLIDSSTGGSGMFLSLHLVTSPAGAVTAGPGLFLGDRWRVNSLSLSGDRVLLDVVRQGPSDPFCCPTLAETRVYGREGNALVFRGLVASVATPAPPATGSLGLAGTRGSAAATAAALSLATVALVLIARRRTATR